MREVQQQQQQLHGENLDDDTDGDKLLKVLQEHVAHLKQQVQSIVCSHLAYAAYTVAKPVLPAASP